MMVALTPFAGGVSASRPPPSTRAEGDVASRSVHSDLARVSTAPAAPESTRHPRWRAAAVLSPLLVAAPVLYMTQCNRLERSASDRAVTITALAVTPTAESGGPWVSGSATGAVAVAVADAAPTKSGEPIVQGEPRPPLTGAALQPSTASESLESAAPPVQGAGSPPATGARPQRSEALAALRSSPADVRRKTPAPLERAPAASARAAPPKPLPSAKPASTPVMRTWDEDSPVPP
jgi:hypothetical protein